MLTRITADLRRSVEHEGFTIDMGEFDALCRSAEELGQSGESQAAMLDRARAIRTLMQAVREEQNRKASDSAIEL